MSEGCNFCGYYALTGYRYCPQCGTTPVPSFMWFIAIEAGFTLMAIVGLVGIWVNREDSFLMGWILLITGAVFILHLPFRYRTAVARYQEEQSREKRLELH